LGDTSIIWLSGFDSFDSLVTYPVSSVKFKLIDFKSEGSAGSVSLHNIIERDIGSFISASLSFSLLELCVLHLFEKQSVKSTDLIILISFKSTDDHTRWFMTADDGT